MADTIYISRTKFNELTEKLNHLKKVEFPVNRDAMRIAIETGGGMHDNAAYEHAAHQEKILLIQISELEQLLLKAKIINDNEIDISAVRIGMQVRVMNLDNSEETVFVVVGAYGMDPESNRISYLAPIAKGLIGKKTGEIAEIQIPKGRLRLKILSIEKAQNW